MVQCITTKNATDMLSGISRSTKLLKSTDPDVYQDEALL